MFIKSNYAEQLNSWWLKLKRYTVSYKKGFYHLYNLANSPYTMIESFDRMPFCEHDKKKKALNADTIFLKVELLYAEFQEGLWVFVSDLYYKKNQVMNNIYDPALPKDYHFINLHYRETQYSKSMLVNGLVFANRAWSVFKAGNATADYHFTNSKEKNITLYFTEKWLTKFIPHLQSGEKSNIIQFINSDSQYLLSDDGEKNDFYFELFHQLIQMQDGEQKEEKLLELIKQFFNSFETTLINENISEEHFKLSDLDRRYVLQTEKLILDHLIKEFPGIESLAKKVGVSPTKLKADFKKVHKKTIYEFYSEQQMKLAHQLLAKKEYIVKDVAKLMGYDNPSKFSARFKEQYGVSPSAISSQTKDK